MTEIVFAFNATSASSDHYLGLCRVEGGESIFGNLQDAIRDATGEEYAYLESVDLYTDNLDHKSRCRELASLLIKDFQRAYEVEIQ
jgi:hypothetical protein